MPNLQEEAEMLDWAGINFGEETTYLLQQSLKKLAVMSGADSVAFCGKIYGTNNDYWIASGRMDRAEEDVKDIEFEQRGKGVNRLVYWVSTNLLSDWVQLPDARPEHIIAARKIKHVFSGDLNATFSSNPAFPGKERHLLRAQLARIFHATSIVPAGLFEIDEETQQLKYAEEYEFPSTADLNDAEKWVNLYPQILKIGRTAHVYDDETIPEDWSDEKKEAYAAMKEADQPADAFRPITEHTKMPDQGNKPSGDGEEDQGLPSWTFKIVGDKQVYNMADDKTACYAVNVIRSLRWPGALTVSKGGKYLNFYLGFGMKRNDSSYQPTEPPEVQADPDEAEMQDEPTPKEAPEELPEEDTDKEEEKEEDE